jgi:hypothetical protein
MPEMEAGAYAGAFGVFRKCGGNHQLSHTAKLFYLRQVEMAHRDIVQSCARILFRKIICLRALQLQRHMYYSQ